jgi:hypothetical protein
MAWLLIAALAATATSLVSEATAMLVFQAGAAVGAIPFLSVVCSVLLWDFVGRLVRRAS